MNRLLVLLALALTGGPAALALERPFPNPSGSHATAQYGLPLGQPVRLAVYDALGRRVAVLAEGAREAGWPGARPDGRGLPSGVHVVRLEAGERVLTQRLTLLC